MGIIGIEQGYTGRGIIMGLATGTVFTQFYWVSGRSANSRNRVMVAQNDEIWLRPFDVSVPHDPRLTVYCAMKTAGNFHIVSNGAHTETFAQVAYSSKDFGRALAQWSYEDDPPIYTSRIAGWLEIGATAQIIKLGKIVRDGHVASPLRASYSLADLAIGNGVCLHTYDPNIIHENNPAIFRRDPYSVILNGDLESLAHQLWAELTPQFRVALAAKSIDLATGKVIVLIINTLGGK